MKTEDARFMWDHVEVHIDHWLSMWQKSGGDPDSFVEMIGNIVEQFGQMDAGLRDRLRFEDWSAKP